jgi:16S rRNA (cytosine967-C5)-methyltransferase
MQEVPGLAVDSLAFAIQHAGRIVNDVLAGRPADAGFEAIRGPASARGAVRDIAFHALRKLGCAQVVLTGLTRQAPEAPVQALLLVSLALVLDAEPAPDAPHYGEFTVVDQAVRAAAALPNGPRIKGLVNGVLRSFLRERAARLEQALQDPVARWNYPQWWIDALARAHPKSWQAILAAGNQRAPLCLRVNRRWGTATSLLARFDAAGLSARALDAHCVIVEPPRPVTELPGFSEGAFSVQDWAAQQAAVLLNVRDGQHVLDACAAPGGKTCHLLELADCDVLALDSDPARLDRIHDNLGRLGLTARVLAGDAGQPSQWWDGRLFDRILLDAPCTASGIVRRHPDIRWLRRKDDARSLARQQRRLLDALWPLLAPGGRMVYATCSVWPEEGMHQIAAFQQRTGDSLPLPGPGLLLPSATERDNHDGFFYAVLEKRLPAQP